MRECTQEQARRNTAGGRRAQGPTPLVNDVIARVRFVARAHGYAIGVHGSLIRDVDLIAAPWASHCATPDELAQAIADEIGTSVKERRTRAHGRIGYVVLLPGRDRPNYINLSVMAPFDASKQTRSD